MVPQDDDMQAMPVSQIVRCSRHNQECVQGFNREPLMGPKRVQFVAIAASIYTLGAMEEEFADCHEQG